jgi:hypothetical protein
MAAYFFQVIPYVTPSTPALAFFRNPRNAAYNASGVIMCPIE